MITSLSTDEKDRIMGGTANEDPTRFGLMRTLKESGLFFNRGSGEDQENYMKYNELGTTGLKSLSVEFRSVIPWRRFPSGE